MSILTKPYGNTGWCIIFDHKCEQNSEFIIQNVDDENVDLTIVSRVPSIYDKHTQLNEFELSGDYDNACSVVDTNFNSLYNEFGAHPFPDGQPESQDEFVDNIHTFSWRKKVSKEDSFYKVLMGFIEMRD